MNSVDIDVLRYKYINERKPIHSSERHRKNREKRRNDLSIQ